jgi:predicted NUDIX family NTP pyrophosphohydrolase
VRRSAGILLFRRTSPQLEVLLVHPGGPFFAHRDVWGIPKGEYDGTEEPLDAAYREFEEETGFAAPEGEPLPLGEITQRGGKRVVAWALEGDLDAEKVVSNTFTMPWRGRIQAFPEIDEAAWFSLTEAAEKMSDSQQPFLERLVERL